MKTFLSSLIVALALLTLSQASFAEVREIKKMSEILPSIDQDTLVVFDLDNTIIQPAQTLGSDQWHRYVIENGIKQGLDKTAALNRAVSMWESVQELTQVRAVESDTPQIIVGLQQRGIKVMGLTARSTKVIQRSFKQLASIGVDLSKQPIYASTLDINVGVQGKFQQGILFVTPTGDKGSFLVEFLKQIHQSPKKIIFIDDRANNTTSVDAALNAQSVENIEFRYGFADEQVKQFNPVIAEKEWNYFQKHHVVLSDKEAAAFKDVLMMLNEGFKPEEYFTPRKMFDAKGYEVTVAARYMGKVQPSRKHIGEVPAVEADLTFDQVTVKGFDAVVFIGGNGAWSDFLPNKTAHSILISAVNEGRITALICAATGLLATANNLDGEHPQFADRHVTGYFEVEGLLKNVGHVNFDKGVESQPYVVIDGNLITGRDPESAELFALNIINSLEK